MRISRGKLLSEAEATGFREEVLEKVILLLNLLEGFRSHPFLKDRLALKGGTALNLFMFDLPRLSVDIDLNYVGSAERETMLAERPKVELAIRAVCEREGFSIRRMPIEHAGGKWSLRYESALGQGGNLELDLNFVFRVPLWPVVSQDSNSVGVYKASRIPVLDPHELTAGKLTALLARHAARDLFDVHLLLTHGGLDNRRLRLAFVAYGAMNRKDWRTVSVDDVNLDVAELGHVLVPLLRRDFLESVGPTSTWAARLLEECRQAMNVVLPLNEAELDFLDRLLEKGEIEPSLLTKEDELMERIRRHPLLAWKAINVLKHKGNS
jgi:predicted nucleotidyltransferase component of viral defense system